MNLPKIPGVRFRHIRDFNGYAVSDDGRIWSSKREQGVWRELCQFGQIYGRGTFVSLSSRKHMVMRLVFETFSPRSTEGKFIQPIDGNWSNSSFKNLKLSTERWYDRKRPYSRLNVEYIIKARMDGRSVNSIAREFHCKTSRIASILNSPQYEKHRQKAYEKIAG